jgi:hypothetical protein
LILITVGSSWRFGFLVKGQWQSLKSHKPPYP